MEKKPWEVVLDFNVMAGFTNERWRLGQALHLMTNKDHDSIQKAIKLLKEELECLKQPTDENRRLEDPNREGVLQEVSGHRKQDISNKDLQ